jgi:hypothetical protein
MLVSRIKHPSKFKRGQGVAVVWRGFLYTGEYVRWNPFLSLHEIKFFKGSLYYLKNDRVFGLEKGWMHYLGFSGFYLPETKFNKDGVAPC